MPVIWLWHPWRQLQGASFALGFEKREAFCGGRLVVFLIQNAPDSLPETFQQEKRVFAASEMQQRGPRFQVSHVPLVFNGLWHFRHHVCAACVLSRVSSLTRRARVQVNRGGGGGGGGGGALVGFTKHRAGGRVVSCRWGLASRLMLSTRR